MNEQTVRVYLAQIEAEVTKYKGVLDANEIMARVFTAQVQGAVAQSQVEETKIRAYAELVRSKIAITEVYKAEVDAMTAEISAEKMKIEANIAKITAWSKTADAQIAVYGAGIEFYKANTQYNVSTAQITNAVAEAKIRAQIAEAQVAVSISELVSRSIQAENAVRVEAAKTVAATTSSIAAGAMAAVAARASMSYSETNDVTEA
jgi:hypothetical protein